MKQTKLEKQKSKSKKTPIRAGARNPISTPPKRKIGRKTATKRRETAKARKNLTTSEETTNKKVTAIKNTKGQQTPKKKNLDAEDYMLLKDGTAIKILKPHEHVKYLGKQLNLINHTDRDIEERIRKGWIKFSEFKPQLCAKGVSKKQKWLLFESVITSTVLYGSCAWTMTDERRAKLLSAQSKMVRQMLGLQWWKSTAKWEAEQQMDDLKESVSDSLLTKPEDRGQSKSNYKERHKCRSQPKLTRKTHKRYIQGTKE